MASVFLRRRIVDGKNQFEKVVGELADLRRVFDVLTLHPRTDRQVTVLLDKVRLPGTVLFTSATGGEAIPESVFDPTGLVPSFCAHGLELHPVTGERTPYKSQGRTWVLSRLLTLDMSYLMDGKSVVPRVVCHCEEQQIAEAALTVFGDDVVDRAFAGTER